MEYLISTYTNENELVLDFTAGSFTTGEACLNTSRNCILIENDNHYFDVGTKRIAKVKEQIGSKELDESGEYEKKDE